LRPIATTIASCHPVRGLTNNWNNWIAENSEMAPSTFFPPFRCTENLREVTKLLEMRMCCWGGGGGGKIFYSNLPDLRGRPPGLRGVRTPGPPWPPRAWMSVLKCYSLSSPYVIGHTIYIFTLWFVLVLLLSSSFFPRLISAATDWMSAILPHMVWP